MSTVMNENIKHWISRRKSGLVMELGFKAERLLLKQVGLTICNSQKLRV